MKQDKPIFVPPGLNPDYDAEIHKAYIHTVRFLGGYASFIVGHIHNDTQERFEDGTKIMTSQVVSNNDDIYTTTKARYKVNFEHPPVVFNKMSPANFRRNQQEKR